MAKPSVNKGLCIGCGTCASLCPDCFELGDDLKSHVKDSCKEGCCDLQEVVDSCPVSAISLVD